MIKNRLFIAFACISVSLAASASKIESSSITFTIKNAGITVEGSFSGLYGTVDFEPEKYYSAKVDLKIPAKTIETGIDARDKHLRKADYFDVEKYPEIRMTSRFFGKDKEEYRGYFTLHLKGKTGNITMPFHAKAVGDKIEVTGEFELDRRDYGVGGYSLIMSDEVTVKVKLVLSNTGKSSRFESLPVQQDEKRESDPHLPWLAIKPE